MTPEGTAPGTGPGPGSDSGSGPGSGTGTGEELRRHVEELTGDDRRRDRQLFWTELLVVLVVAAALTARELWLT
ncbi:hypothetical protein [Streptomyces filamentosus]|uniref:hypothetical protein n=1 Tax=Streptomyces filamentosus TaxID=67294 RepID=UPI00331E5059